MKYMTTISKGSRDSSKRVHLICQLLNKLGIKYQFFKYQTLKNVYVLVADVKASAEGDFALCLNGGEIIFGLIHDYHAKHLQPVRSRADVVKFSTKHFTKDELTLCKPGYYLNCKYTFI